MLQLNANQTADVVDVTLVLDTSAYTASDLLSDVVSFTGVKENGGKALLTSLSLIDEDDQGAALDLYFSRGSGSFGTINSAPSISDTNARDILGYVAIATADYKDLGGVRVASKTGLNILLEAGATSQLLYVAAVNGSGTPTYTASGLKLRLGLLWY